MIPTVKVESPISEDNPLGYIVINADDMTPDHRIYGEGAEKDTRTSAELKEALNAAGIEFPANAKKADLIALLTAAE